MEVLELKNKIKTKIFDYQKLKNTLGELSNPRRFISSLMAKGYIIRVKKGLYLWDKNIDPSPFSKEILANLIYGPSYISLEYALSYFGLIPERVETVTSVTFKRNKEFETPIGHFEYKHLSLPAYMLGTRLEILSEGQSFIIACPEKALLDTIALRYPKTKITKNFLKEELRMGDLEKLDKKILRELSLAYKSTPVLEL